MIAETLIWMILFAVSAFFLLKHHLYVWHLVHLIYVLVTDFTHCSYARGQSLQKNQFMKISSIRQSQPPGYLLKTQLFIRGDKDCHIVLSTHDSTAKEGAAKYDIGT